MINEKIVKSNVSVDLKRQTLYNGTVTRVISLAVNEEPTQYDFTFGSNNRILMATVSQAWPNSTWTGALVTVSRITISNNVVSVWLSTNHTQAYTIGVTGIYHLA